MKQLLIGIALLTVAGISNGAPTVYTDEALYLADLAALGYSTIHESFEDGTVWADSRNSSTPSVISQGIVWTSNYAVNNIATGTVGGSAPDGSFAIYSLPHGMTTDSGSYCDSAEDPDIPIECFQNDGLKVESETGNLLYAFGGRIDTANSGKVTFLLDGVDINANDTDNIDNWQREGDLADNWSFIGVIDTDGFFSAELRELKGKDFQQVLLFADDFSIADLSPAGSDPCPGLVACFQDVPDSYWSASQIETIADLGITSGCDETHYCPTDPVSRAQMAVFVERGMRGGGYDPGPGVGNIFLDVPPGYWAGGWIELLFMDGITGGCDATHYCPSQLTTRAEMAVFLLRAKYGMDYAPPTPVGVFNDVAVTYWAAGWIEQLAAEGITSGCGGGNYCPADPVNRDQMAVFLVNTFQL